MSRETKLERWVLALGVAGLAFAGYMSGVKFFMASCAFNECPLFLGYPACYYGLAMYLIITVAALARVLGKANREKVNEVILMISGLGILFAGYFTILELPLLLNEGLTAYVLGLPTCAYGLVFYIALFILSIKLRPQNPV